MDMETYMKKIILIFIATILISTITIKAETLDITAGDSFEITEPLLSGCDKDSFSINITPDDIGFTRNNNASYTTFNPDVYHIVMNTSTFLKPGLYNITVISMCTVDVSDVVYHRSFHHAVGVVESSSSIVPQDNDTPSVNNSLPNPVITISAVEEHDDNFLFMMIGVLSFIIVVGVILYLITKNRRRKTK
jgi:hypothetical protein